MKKTRRNFQQFAEFHEGRERTEFGRVLQVMRMEREISLRGFAKKLGWGSYILARLETETPAPTLRIISEIAFAFGMKLGAFFTEYDRIISEEGTR